MSMNVKTIETTKKIIVGILVHVIVRMVKYLASTIDDSMITIININPRNLTSTVSTNFHNKKVRCKMDCYTLHTVFLVIILNRY